LSTSPTSAVRTLAYLNVALYECAANLPNLAEADAIPANTTGNGLPGSRKETLFAIDELFRLTAEFIEVVKSLSAFDYHTSSTSSSTNPMPLGAQSTLSLLEYNQKWSQTGNEAVRTGMRPPFNSLSYVDEATMLIIASCHSRITEIYVYLFKMMQACIEHSLVPQPDKAWVVILPQLQIGSIASPPVHVDAKTPLPSAKVLMYMLMITMLSSQLWEQLAGLIRARGDGSTTPGSTSRSALVGVLWNTMTERTDRLSQTILATKCLLQQGSLTDQV
jgi:hypothetical protein